MPAEFLQVEDSGDSARARRTRLFTNTTLPPHARPQAEKSRDCRPPTLAWRDFKTGPLLHFSDCIFTHTHTHTHTHHRHGRRRNCTTARPTGPARHHPNLAHRGFNWRWPGQDIGHRPYIGRRDPDRVPRCRQLQCQAPAHEHMDAVVHQTPERQGMLPVLCVRKARRG